MSHRSRRIEACLIVALAMVVLLGMAVALTDLILASRPCASMCTADHIDILAEGQRP